MSRQVSEDLTERASTFGLILDDVSLVWRCSVDLVRVVIGCDCNLNHRVVSLQTHLTFGKEFTEAVEMKQVAQQEAERARFVVEKVFISSPKPPASYTCTTRQARVVSVGLRD